MNPMNTTGNDKQHLAMRLSQASHNIATECNNIAGRSLNATEYKHRLEIVYNNIKVMTLSDELVSGILANFLPLIPASRDFEFSSVLVNVLCTMMGCQATTNPDPSSINLELEASKNPSSGDDDDTVDTLLTMLSSLIL